MSSSAWENQVSFWIDVGQNPTVMILAVLFYVTCSKPLFSFLRDKVLMLTPQSQGLKLFVLLHNLLLAVFSLLVFWKSFPLFWTHVTSHGWQSLHCSSQFWNDDGFGYWAHIFYLSKYYEFIDSWILILKGKDASFLQVYHHAGVVLAMYLGTTSQANWMVWLVVLNSWIHTFMYTYFCAATVGYKSPLAKMLTTAQLTQFVVGIALSSSCYFYTDCVNTDQWRSLVFVQVYASGLIYLFYQMYQKKYKKSKSNQSTKGE